MDKFPHLLHLFNPRIHKKLLFSTFILCKDDTDTFRKIQY